MNRMYVLLVMFDSTFNLHRSDNFQENFIEITNASMLEMIIIKGCLYVESSVGFSIENIME